MTPFLICELTLRAFNIAAPTEAMNPEIGFEAIHPLFELNDAGDRFEIAESRRAYFCPDSFRAAKSPKEYRIFCLGGSTVQGRPYSIETSFTTWLELSLNAADTSQEWEAINCGGISYASYRLVPILEEVLTYQPDMIVVYTGHNEFLEARTFSKRPSRQRLSNVRTLNLLKLAWQGRSQLEEGQDTEILAAEVDALLDYRGGLDDYHRDDNSRDVIVAQYADNVSKMINLCRDASVPIVLLNPAANLKDTPPFKVESSVHVPSDDVRAIESLVSAARGETAVTRKAELLEKAVALDARDAGVRFLLGHAYLGEHRMNDALTQFITAKDEDVCPLRMIEPLHEALANTAQASRTILLDVRLDFMSRADDGIPGDRQFLDHIHPSIDNHKAIARLLVNHLIATGDCRPSPNWESQRDESFRAHLGTLDTPYYAKGKQRLEGLIRWTQGRANKLRDGSELPPGLDEESESNQEG